jgi:5-methylcytosine-specific restriction endonuclease McrA
MPSSPGYKRDYKQENKYKSSPEQIHARVIRNKNRLAGLKAGIVHKGDGKEIDHKVPLSKGGAPDGSNLRVVSASSNDSFKRNSSGALVSQTSTRESKPGHHRKRK